MYISAVHQTKTQKLQRMLRASGSLTADRPSLGEKNSNMRSTERGRWIFEPFIEKFRSVVKKAQTPSELHVLEHVKHVMARSPFTSQLLP